LRCAAGVDRPLAPEVKTRRLAFRGALSILAIATLATTLLGARSLLRPSISRARIRTARVDVGPVEAILTGSGTVLPEREQVLSSPIDARVLQVLKRPGASVAPGEPILELDVAESALALARLDQSFALKENQQAKARLDLASTLSSLKSQVEIKRLQLETFEASRERNEKLFAQGLVSEELLRQSRLDEARARVEVTQLSEAKDLATKTAENEERGLTLERDTLLKEREEARRTLRLATTRADRRGVLTAIVPEPGATVHRGDVLARIADLSSYRVEATLSDVHAARIAPGLPAVVELNETLLPGSVTRVLPTIQNGVLTAEVALEQPAHPLLRSNLRVEVRFVLARKERALRVAKGRLEGSGAAPELYVLSGGTAVKTPIRLGLTGSDRWEVTDGLREGDQVIVSDMREFGDAREVAIR
jgi:HlyD family secretion protein